jgi:RNA recognition motif-containing protein
MAHADDRNRRAAVNPFPRFHIAFRREMTRLRSAGPATLAPGMIVLIRNIDRSITEEHVRRMLDQYGKVRTFDLVLDKATGKSKGFGFADMPSIDDAEKMIKALNGTQLGSEKLRVKRAAASSLLGTNEPRPKTVEKKRHFAKKAAKKTAKKWTAKRAPRRGE